MLIDPKIVKTIVKISANINRIIIFIVNSPDYWHYVVILTCYSFSLTSCFIFLTVDGVRLNTAPGNCCFNFYTRPLRANVSNVIKTHSSCLRPKSVYFLNKLNKWKQICYSQTFQWALDQYQKINTPEGSGGR
uniref:Chemokine interleukin-8-like domain-containing protein n=1 Tax=Acanthochromis polyacanthus TaxID=80966 RepID=A0A3Q1F3B2_9TELE